LWFLWKWPLQWVLQALSRTQSEEVNYIENKRRHNFSNNPYPNSYNQRWRNNTPNYGGNQEHGASSSGHRHQQQHSLLYERIIKLEDTLYQFNQRLVFFDLVQLENNLTIMEINKNLPISIINTIDFHFNPKS